MLTCVNKLCQFMTRQITSPRTAGRRTPDGRSSGADHLRVGPGSPIPDLAWDERGVAAPMVAVLLVVLLGFSALVADVGVVYGARRQMQNAVDAAALAGADTLLTDALNFESSSLRAAISSKVASYAGANGINSGELEPVTFTYKNPSARQNPIIKVTAHRNVPLMFASVLGLQSQSVRVEAASIVAKLAPLGIWPWGVTQDSLQYNKLTQLKVGARNNMVGNFMALDLTGQDQQGGAKSYQYNILNKFNDVPKGPVPPGIWTVDTETGNMAGPTRDPVLTLLQNPSCPSPADIRCPRLALVPVLRAKSWSEVTGKSQVDVVDFAVFQLEGYDESGGTGQDTVWGKFVAMAKGVGGVSAFDTDLSGLIGARLWH